MGDEFVLVCKLVGRRDARQGARVCCFRPGNPKHWDMILCFVSLPNTAVVLLLATSTPIIRQSDRNLMAGPVAVGLSCFCKTKQGFHDGSTKPHSAPPPARRVAWTSARRTHWGVQRLLCPRPPPEPSTEPEKHPGNNAKFPGNMDRPAVVPIGRRELPADDGLAATQSCTTQSTTWNLMNGVCLSGSPAVLMH